MSNPQFWSFQNKGETRNLYILSEIASRESWWSDVVTPKRFISQLNSGTGDLNVWIDSPGGDAFAGAAIYEALRTYSSTGRGKVIVNITGIAASAAGLIAMAGDEVRISIVGTFMLHDPWSSPSGNAKKLRATADILDEIREGQIRAYMRKSGKTHDEVLALIEDAGTYMNARTAIEHGFADSILSDDDNTGAEWVKATAEVRVSSCIQREADHISAALESSIQASAATKDGSETPWVSSFSSAVEAQADAGQAPQEPGGDAEPGADSAETNEQARALLRACLACYEEE